MKKKRKRRKTVSRCAGVILALVVLITIVTTLINMLIPELITSIRNLIFTLPAQINQLVKQMNHIQLDDSAMTTMLKNAMNEASTSLQNWMRTDLLNKVNEVMTHLTVGLYTLVMELFHAVIGVIVSVYILFGKETFINQSKKATYAIFPTERANLLIHIAVKTNEIFGGFIIGKIIDAGLYGARAAMIGGCVGTSNVLAGQLFDVPVMGTHAHSWIMTFPDEYTAFKYYAELYPDNCTLLVDTYDTLKSGVPNAIRVFQEFKDAGKPLKKYGIRLDSGDLAYLSKKARKMLDEAGFPDASICASNDLDEYLLHDLKAQGAAINSWGVGTHLITSKDCPSFGGVYKLSAIKNENGEFIPKIKISENTEKITNPGNKTIYRVYEKETGKIKADLICFADETFDENQDLLLFDPLETWKKTKLAGGTYIMREMLVPIFKNGECIYTSPSVTEIAEYCKQEKDSLWDETKRLFYPHRVYVDLSQSII